jgi:undecaprenyl-diphosphatase
MTSTNDLGAPPKKADSPAPTSNVARRLVREMDTLDAAVYDAIAGTPTPTLDKPLTRLSDAATYSRLWIALAVGLGILGGPQGRRTAVRGLLTLAATSLTADLTAKHLFPRQRPDRGAGVAGRQARMPTSSSFPSGHAASAFAFATTVSADFPVLALPLYATAAAVGYSRVHMGVHYPLDVVGGAVLGLALGSSAGRDCGAQRRATTAG